MNTEPRTQNSTQLESSLDAPASVLWASAMVILAMIIVQAGRLGGVNAYAGDVADVASLHIITSRSQDDEDILSILDEDEETISAYAVVNARTIELYDTVDLARLFTRARGATGGGRR